MNLRFKWSRMESMTAHELYEVIQARESVFVVEQQCAYQDADGADPHSWHLCVLLDGELAAYARVVEAGVKYEEPSIGRVITLKEFRNLKIGRALVAEAIAFTESNFQGQGIRISAQAHLQNFYGSLGFQPVGDTYDEDGIPHIEMFKPPVENAA
ncbi:ElaA protein [Comamonas thiooxydans]|uniref:GNAT family N-acetyltransferase n=1 Tax=Comamonas thiooxydans TaxID=363952 RepID=UPI001E615CA2|nr:GNAT family N-acetyltransferase [Comamonas thiooxydans]BDB72253.1 ElaA protein [Comamonas thiooxydans]